MNKALALALALTVPTLTGPALTGPALAATPTSLTVWLPEQGQTATLSSQGLTAADGGRIVLNRPAYDLPFERPISGGFVRLTPAGKTDPARLEVVQGGKVTASRTFPEARYGARLQGTERGPCVSSTETDSDKSITRCFAPDLKTEWVKLPGQPFLSASGKVAYTVLTDWKLEKPAGDDVDVIRRDLGTGEEVTLSYRVPLPGQTLVVPSGMSDPIDRRATLGLAAELPGERYLVCASTTIPKDPCRLDIVDRDFKKLLSLQGNASSAAGHQRRQQSLLFGQHPASLGRLHRQTPEQHSRPTVGEKQANPAECLPHARRHAGGDSDCQHQKRLA